MEEAVHTRTSGGQPSSSPSSSATPTNTTSITTYTPTALTTIGQKCSQRLPPANAVQAMFLYEMQRQSEAEQLFKNQMFRLARNEDASTTQQRRIEELETKVVHLERTMMNKEIEERLATSKSTMQMLGEKLMGCLKRVEGLEAVMAKAKSRIESVERDLKEVEGVDEEAPESKAAFARMMKGEIDVLFQDRDGILEMIRGIKQRLASLEAPPTARESTTGAAEPHPQDQTRTAPASVTNISAANMTNGIGITHRQPDQTCPPAAAKNAANEEAEEKKLKDEELERQIAEREAAKKAEEERERALRAEKAKDKEVTKPQKAGRAAIAPSASNTSGTAPHLRSVQSRPQSVAATTSITSGSTPQVQRLPVRTAPNTNTNGTPRLDLSIPKGAAHVGLRSSAHAPPPVPAPSNLRPFSPGKPWTS